MKNILLFGMCEYELIGLYHVLKAGGYNVVNATIDNYQEDVYDLLIVALSSVPVIGWGKYFGLLHTFSCDFRGRIILLVPEKIGSLSIFPGIDKITTGKISKNKILSIVNDVIYKKNNNHMIDKYNLLSSLELKYLRFLSGRGLLYNNAYYYCRSRIVQKIGVNNMHVINLIGTKNILNYFARI
ncbi:hypothetical protein JNP96_29785 (plasmid) [Escherichia coli]|uniref:Uncharacterized protein n=1 Tax=Escherichia coli TaxID=562 RepID=A0A895P1A3_ECOLX|nr:hypothetical protein JNP96_29785 [Escherichia coli]HBH4362216.1 hypothetical protein [Escherichia coli]